MVTLSMLKLPPGSKTFTIMLALQHARVHFINFKICIYSSIAFIIQCAFINCFSLGGIFGCWIIKFITCKFWKAVPLAYNDASIFAFKFLAVAPNNHFALRCPLLDAFFPSNGFAKIKIYFKRFGITVSTFILFSKVAPPTFTFASQLPVGASHL